MEEGAGKLCSECDSGDDLVYAITHPGDDLVYAITHPGDDLVYATTHSGDDPRVCVCACVCILKYAYLRAFVSTLGSYKMGHHKLFIINELDERIRFLSMLRCEH